MNKKEAREIVDNGWEAMPRYGEAKGYFEAIEKLKEVLDFLVEIEFADNCPPDISMRIKAVVDKYQREK